ncbi:hypothetical protein MAFF301560_15580 [Ralstonia solanacearum]|nr:hypothetical protein MAFF301560_15580 [Ralstonia solanacearum]BEU47076.1 hypothetical protein MAFF211519_24010 [Ralstonia pseudosolanacearum]
MSVTGSCWRGTEAVSLCPGQIRRVSDDGLKKKNPRRRCVYGDACNPGGERGRPKRAAKPRGVWLPILFSVLTRKATHNCPPPLFKWRATAAADGAGQADAVRCPMLGGLPRSQNLGSPSEKGNFGNVSS